MTHLLRTFLLSSVLLITACSSTPEPRDTKVVRFALREDNVESWQEKGDGFEVHLNREGQRKLSSLTRNNQGSELEVYAGRIFLMSEVIETPLRGQAIYVAVNDNIRDRARTMMPIKKAAD